MGAERLNVELVAHGTGLLLFIKQNRVAEELERLSLTRAALIDQVDRIMSTLIRLMEWQEQGWAHIKS